MKIRIYYNGTIKIIDKEGKEHPLSDYYILYEKGFMELEICLCQNKK